MGQNITDFIAGAGCSAVETETISKNGVKPKDLNGRSRYNILWLLCIPLFFASCSTADVFVKSNAISYSKSHKTLAVVQYGASVQCGNRIRSNDCDGFAENPTLSAYTPTASHYSVLDELLKYNEHLDIEVQDEILTNKMLSQAGYSYSFEKLKNDFSTLEYKRSSKFKKERQDSIWTPQELAEILNVDGIMLVTNEDFYAKKTGGQIASEICLGIWNSFPIGLIVSLATMNQTLQIHPIEICLYDGKSGTLLYKYKNASTWIFNKSFYKKLPYYRKK